MNRFTCAALIALAGSAAFGQDDVLRGPKVKNDAPPAVESTFVPGMSAWERGTTLNVQQFQRVLQVLRSDETPAEHRATQEQWDAITAEVRAHRERVQEYMAPFREELAGLERRARAEGDRRETPRAPARERVRRDGQAEAPEAMEDGRERPARANRPAPAREGMEMEGRRPPMDEKSREAVAQRLQEIRQGAPQTSDLQRRVWSLLTEPQREIADKAVRTALEQLQEQRLERMVQVEARRQAADGQEINIDRLMQRLPEDARKRLEAMTPEQREATIRRLMERRQGENTERRGRGRDGGRAEPPSMDGLDLPNPDKD